MERRKKRLRLPLVMALILIIAVGGYCGIALSRPVAAIETKPVTLQTSAPSVALPWPSYGQAAVGAVGYGVLATHGQQQPLATASLAKIMTALAVLHKYPLKPGQQGPIITITPADQKIYDYYYVRDGSLAAMKVGEKISEYQALEAMLLPSANNFADILAIWAYGSLDNYSDYANAYARSIGMTNSHFVDGSGFSGQTTSTASDLVKLAIVAIQDPVIAQIVHEPQAKIPVAGVIYNVNWLLDEHGIIGMKTGNNNQDHGAYMAATQFKTGDKTITLVSVNMGAPKLATALTDSLPLLAAAQNNFHETTVVTKGQVVGHYYVPWSSDVPAVATDTIRAITWNKTIKPQLTLEQLAGPAPAGKTVGLVTANLPGAPKVAVKLARAVPAVPWTWRLYGNW